MLEATLNEKVAKTIDHQGIGLIYYSFHDFVLLISSTDFELLLQKNGGLLVIVADNLVHYILPITRHILIQESSVVERLKRWNVRLYSISTNLEI